MSQTEDEKGKRKGCANSEVVVNSLWIPLQWKQLLSIQSYRFAKREELYCRESLLLEVFRIQYH